MPQKTPEELVREYTEELKKRQQKITGSPLVSLDGVETQAGLAAADIVPAAEQERIKQSLTRFSGQDLGAFNQLPPSLVTSSDDTDLATKAREFDVWEEASRVDSSDAQTNNVGNSDPGKVQKGSSGKFKPIPNVLKAYTTWTYNLSLHALSTDQYNNLLKGGVKDYRGQNVLISSGGRKGFDTGLVRHRLWKDDMYFDKMSMTSVIGANDQGRGTNVLSCEFTVVEPYGITFLDKLAETAKGLGYENPLDLICLIQIDFFGYDDKDLNPTKINNSTRRIPVRLNKVDLNYNQNGATYNILATVVNHSIFDNETMCIQAPVRLGQVKDQDRRLANTLGTTEEGRQKAKAEYQDKLNRREAEIKRIEEVNKQGGNEFAGLRFDRETDLTLAKKGLVSLPEISDVGLGSALNGYWEWVKEVTDLSHVPYTFQFLLKNNPTIADDFENVKLLDELIVDVRNRAAARAAKAYSKVEEGKNSASDGSNAASEGAAGVNISFPTGSNIIEIINALFKCTDYFSNQVKDDIKVSKSEEERAGPDKETRSKEFAPLNFFKISPVVKFGPYIPEKRDFQKQITLVILPYKHYGNRLPFGGRGAPRKADCVKEYNYLFTGKNDDILDLKIDFNYTYYNFLTVGSENKQKDKDRPAKNTYDKDSPTEEKFKTYKTSIIGGKMFTVPLTLQAVSHVYTDPTPIRINDLFNNIYSTSRADMIQLDMKILGDPSYIQEQEVLLDPLNDTKVSTIDPRLYQSGSLIVNDNDLLVNLNFKFTNDIDTDQGTYTYADKDLGIKTRLFSGIYKVLKIRNDFERGVFTQVISIAKLYNDDESKLGGATTPNPRDTDASTKQFSIVDTDQNFVQVGMSQAKAIWPTSLSYPDTPVNQLPNSPLLSSVNSTATNLQNQAKDKLQQVTQAAKQGNPLINADNTIAFNGAPVVGKLNSAELTKLFQKEFKNAGDDTGQGE